MGYPLPWLSNLSPAVYSTAGGWALAIGLVWVIVRILRQQVRDTQKDRDDRLQELNTIWRDHNERLQMQLDKLNEVREAERSTVVSQVMTVGRAMDAFVKALPPPGGGNAA